MLIVIMLSFVILNSIMLSVIMPNVGMPSVMALTTYMTDISIREEHTSLLHKGANYIT
jgi:hypothetical protein